MAINNRPIVEVKNNVVLAGTKSAFMDIVDITDLDGRVVEVYIRMQTSGRAVLLLDNKPVKVNETITLTAPSNQPISEQLKRVSIQGGSSSGTDKLVVNAWDGIKTAYDAGKSPEIPIITNKAPIVNSLLTEIQANQSVSLRNVANIYDPDGEPLVAIAISDKTPGGSRILFDGTPVDSLLLSTKQGVGAKDGVRIEYGTNMDALLARVSLKGGGTAGNDKIQINAWDGKSFAYADGAIPSLSITTVMPKQTDTPKTPVDTVPTLPIDTSPKTPTDPYQPPKDTPVPELQLSGLDDAGWNLVSGDNQLYSDAIATLKDPTIPVNKDAQDKWNALSSDAKREFEKLAKDLSRAVLGRDPDSKNGKMTAGYIYDASYLDAVKTRHSGIDLDVDDATGASIKSPIDGKVQAVTTDSTKTGNNLSRVLVKEENSNRTWVFLHVSPSVKTGDAVVIGQDIAYVNPYSNAHVHVEVRENYTGTSSLAETNDASAIDKGTMSPLRAYYEALKDESTRNSSGDTTGQTSSNDTVVSSKPSTQNGDSPSRKLAITTGGASREVEMATYSGPVSGLQNMYIGADEAEAMRGSDSGDFLHLRGGDDAVDGAGGSDVLDGGLGSNFLTGGSGSDTFFVDGRGGGATWSTVTDLEKGEWVTAWGWVEGVSKLTWNEMAGANGYKGATAQIDLDANGTIDISMTISGRSSGAIVSTGGLVDSSGYLAFALK